jgi:hypothetical protein
MVDRGNMRSMGLSGDDGTHGRPYKDVEIGAYKDVPGDPGYPTLRWNCPESGDMLELAFGYLEGSGPVATLFSRDNESHVAKDGTRVVYIPRDVLKIAYDQGWPEEVSAAN